MRKRRVKQIVRLFDDAIAAEKRHEFQNAKHCYKKIVEMHPNSCEALIGRERMADMDALSKEKMIYKRIHRNAKRILTEIGMDVAASPLLMEILLEADAIDLESEQAEKAFYISIKEDYLEACLDGAASGMFEDPGENAFGTGPAPPFLFRPDKDELKPASPKEFEEIVRTAAEFSDILGIFSLPVATEKSMSVFKCSELMDKHFPDLKMTCTCNMTEKEKKFFAHKDDWLDGTSLMTSLTFRPNMVEPFVRSAKAGNNLLLLDLTVAGASGPASPEALFTQIHAHVLFMMVLAKTVNPGIACVHGGIPDVLGIGGRLGYSDPGQWIINSALARLNLWVTGLPSAQSGGSTSIISDIPEAAKESGISRNRLRTYGVHILRHAMGAMGNLTFFSLDKFIMDCEKERESKKQWSKGEHNFIYPLYFPEDRHVVKGIREIVEKGGAKNTEHTLTREDRFRKWRDKIIDAARRKIYYPDFENTVCNGLTNIERASEKKGFTQLQDTFFKD